MDTYTRFNRNGGTSINRIGGLTLAFHRDQTEDGKPIVKRVMKSRVRYGKTAKDHRSGAWKQRLENRTNRTAA
jgi:hypothetical protein